MSNRDYEKQDQPGLEEDTRVLAVERQPHRHARGDPAAATPLEDRSLQLMHRERPEEQERRVRRRDQRRHRHDAGREQPERGPPPGRPEVSSSHVRPEELRDDAERERREPQRQLALSQKIGKEPQHEGEYGWMIEIGEGEML